MSAENFHTIKKIPPNTLIVEPPPEFADNFNSKYPLHHSTTTPSTVIRTTHIQSYASRLTQNIIAKAIRTFDRRHLATKEIYCEKHAAAKLRKQQQKAMEYEYLRKKRFTNGYSIYGSDSFLDSYNKTRLSSGKNSNSNINIVEPDDDIYDEPNTEYDVIYKDNKDTILCTKRIVRSLEKKKMETRAHLYCNTEDLYYEKFKSKSCNTTTAPAGHSSHNKFQSNSFQKKFDKFLRSKFLTNNLTPTTTTSSIFYSFCRAGTNNSNPCNPTSKSSLSSRLSSSHNSLTVPTNKADDSIFITQAMSHDQLGTHSIEISDFYNVPMDSDIYTLPIDVIHQEEERQSSYRHHRAMSDNNLLGSSTSTRSHKFHRSKNKRSKRKKRSDASNESSRKMSSGNVVTSQSFTVSHDYNRATSDRPKLKLSQTSTSSVAIDSSTKLRTKSSTDTAKTIKGDTNNNSKYASTASTKKSQFSISLNLKQKFCSIFRFRRSHQSPTRSVTQSTANETEKKVNLSTRALPPLPGLGELFWLIFLRLSADQIRLQMTKSRLNHSIVRLWRKSARRLWISQRISKKFAR